MKVLWSQKIRSNPSLLSDAIAFYATEYVSAKEDVEISLRKLEREKMGSSHVFEYRLSQLQDLEAILKTLNINLMMLRKKLYKKFLEDTPKANIDFLVDIDDNVNALENSINEVALMRNLYLGILKGLHIKSSSVHMCIELRKSNDIIVIE
jgi:hypothetical protein